MKSLCIIPARLQSSRLPEKLLMQLGEKSIIEHVFDNCMKAEIFSDILIAVEDEKMLKHCSRFTTKIVMTSKDHISGTDRIHEAYVHSTIAADYIVNVQADEPFLYGNHIKRIVQAHVDTDCDVMTAVAPITDIEELISPSCVKVAMGNENRALYFSRSPIPFVRDAAQKDWLNHHIFMKHIGIYSYTSQSLHEFVNSSPGKLERMEYLEQLRLLEQGYRYSCTELEYDGFGIDTMEDYNRALERITRD
jgi:3-deoxy-manno-octulosonate cytidylyltransferase (CMP-KDO synthetase)